MQGVLGRCGGEARAGEAVGMFVWIWVWGCSSVQAPVPLMRSPRRGPHKVFASVKDCAR